MRVFGVLSVFAAALIASTASSDQFGSSHVADLGKNFSEKVRCIEPVLRQRRKERGMRKLSNSAGWGWQALLCEVLCSVVR